MGLRCAPCQCRLAWSSRCVHGVSDPGGGAGGPEPGGAVGGAVGLAVGLAVGVHVGLAAGCAVGAAVAIGAEGDVGAAVAGLEVVGLEVVGLDECWVGWIVGEVVVGCEVVGSSVSLQYRSGLQCPHDARQAHLMVNPLWFRPRP